MNKVEVQTKLDTVADNLEKLAKLPTRTYEEFVSDFRTLDSALHRLQTSVQALVDLGAYIVSSLGLRTPTSTVDVGQVLREGGLLDDEHAATLTKMIQFRSRVVHLYNRIDPRILYEIVTQELGDFRGFFRLFLDLIERHPDEP